MWRLTFLRDWFYGLLDRAAYYWIARPSRRLAEEIEQWMHDKRRPGVRCPSSAPPD